MSEARTEIFGKVRNALGRESIPPELRKTLDKRMVSPPDLIRPAFDELLIERFATQLESVAASFERVVGEAEIFPAITRYLESFGLGKCLVAAPSLKKLSWPGSLDVHFGGTRGEDLVSVTGCFAAVAETGSVVLLSEKDSPTGLNFLPDYHIAIVTSKQLVRHIEDVWTPLRQRQDGIPRTINFISGPSKTADVEQTLQVGAHGPRCFHVVFVDDGRDG